MDLSPGLYKRIIRPRWFTNTYINTTLCDNFDFSNKTVLDFGCGTGTSCILFNPSYYLGIDCNPSRVSYARHLYPDFTFKCFEGGSLPAEEGSIDYIVIISVLHHIPTGELSKCIKEFKRILKPGGSILAIEPCFYTGCRISNSYMSLFDKGKFIRDENGYLSIFNKNHFSTKVIKRYNQLFLYNKLFFTATPFN